MENLTLRKLLVPVDHSHTSLNALALAVAMSERHGAEIRLLFVVDSRRACSAGNSNDGVDPVQESLMETTILRLQTLAETTSANHSVHCSIECRTGVVCDTIVQAANEFNADLIVMGTCDTSGIRAYFMGLEAYRVVEAAQCPVLTVPNHRKWTDFNEIIFPVRPIPGATEKYDITRAISLKNNAHLTVLGLFDRYDELKNEILTSVVDNLKNQLMHDEIKGEILLLKTDSIAYAIQQKISEFDADLIVITADINAASPYSLLGPFAQQIINYANVPVLSVRPHFQSVVQV
ncbi:universal stress protein [Spirosoma arcticum]